MEGKFSRILLCRCERECVRGFLLLALVPPPYKLALCDEPEWVGVEVVIIIMLSVLASKLDFVAGKLCVVFISMQHNTSNKISHCETPLKINVLFNNCVFEERPKVIRNNNELIM